MGLVLVSNAAAAFSSVARSDGTTRSPRSESGPPADVLGGSAVNPAEPSAGAKTSSAARSLDYSDETDPDDDECPTWFDQTAWALAALFGSPDDESDETDALPPPDGSDGPENVSEESDGPQTETQEFRSVNVAGATRDAAGGGETRRSPHSDGTTAA